MKKFFMAMIGLVLCITLIGCSSNSNISANIVNKMDKLTSTIHSLNYASDSDLIYSSTNDVTQVGLFGNYNPYYSNVNTYGNYYGGMYGMYPVNGIVGYGNMNGFGMNGYGMNGFNNGFNGYGMNYGNNNYGFNGGNGIFASNIDTYRINSISKDGKTTTTIDTFKNGKPVNSFINTDTTPNQTKYTNLSSVCGSCVTSNNYCNQLKSSILSNIDYVKNLATQINNNKITLNNDQKNSINELLENILRTTSKINMTKGEFNTELNKVKTQKISYTTNPTLMNSKYVKLLSCMDTRNSYFQSILNTLLQLENCIDGNCQDNYCWNGSCTNGTCTNGACQNCNDCPTCSTCTDCSSCENCLNCTNCENCKDCINCENCKDCSNLANAKDCIGNNCNNSQNTLNDTNNDNTETNTPNTIVGPSIGEEQINEIDTSNDFYDSMNRPQNLDSDEIVNDNFVDDKMLDEYNFDKEQTEYLEQNIPNHKPPEAHTLPHTIDEEDNEREEELNDNNIIKNTPTPVENSILNENDNENNKSLTA